jgi:hypothetical protein
VVEVPLVDGSVVEASIDGWSSAVLSTASVFRSAVAVADVRVGAVPVLSSGFAGHVGTAGVVATGTGAGAGFFGAAAPAAFFGAGALDEFERTISAHVVDLGFSGSSAFSAGTFAFAEGELAPESCPDLPWFFIRALPFPSCGTAARMEGLPVGVPPAGMTAYPGTGTKPGICGLQITYAPGAGQ